MDFRVVAMVGLILASGTVPGWAGEPPAVRDRTDVLLDNAERNRSTRQAIKAAEEAQARAAKRARHCAQAPAGKAACQEPCSKDSNCKPPKASAAPAPR